MKRLAVFCDGTWNQLSARHPSNVVRAAQAVQPRGKDGVVQLTYYNEGLGTSYVFNQALERLLAGAFGVGLFEKIADAYRFLVFNYEPGDRIFIFGFSRGAYTARSLAGLIRKCGIVTRDRLHMVRAAFDFYKEQGPSAHPDGARAQRFRLENSHDRPMKETDRVWRELEGVPAEFNPARLFEIAYLGVWDTVGALGVPKHLFLEWLFRTAAKHQFHDTELSSIVTAARHAVAIDEDRRSFEPALWDNLERLDALPGRQGRYRQVWFPGDHGSVGGGGDIVGLSNGSLVWILEGAEAAGLAVDPRRMAAYRDVRDAFAPLRNTSTPPGWFERFYARAAREGPKSLAELSESALERLTARPAGKLWKPYRPKALEKLANQLPIVPEAEIAESAQ